MTSNLKVRVDKLKTYAGRTPLERAILNAVLDRIMWPNHLGTYPLDDDSHLGSALANAINTWVNDEVNPK